MNPEVVGHMDSALQPLLVGRGGAVPVEVVFLGAIVGFAAMGITGLFVGPSTLAAGYKRCLEADRPG